MEPPRHRGGIEVELERAGAGGARRLDETGGGIDLARGADGNEEVAGRERGENAVHPIGHLAEPDDVGAERAGGAGRAGGEGSERRLPAVAGIAGGAPGREQLAVHVEEPAGAAALVEIVDILGDDEEVSRPFAVEPAERKVGGIGLDLGEAGATGIVEGLDERRVAAKGLGCCHVLDAVAFPEAIGAAEGGHSGFGGNARASEDDDALVAAHGGKTGAARNQVQGVPAPEGPGGLRFAGSWPTPAAMRGERLAVGVLGAGGRMGRAVIEAVLAAPDLELAGGVERPGHPACGTVLAPGLVVAGNASPVAHRADVLIDFTSPEALPETLRAAGDAGCALVIGTTGLSAADHAAIDAAATSLAILQAANTSLGVTLLAALVEAAAARLPDWDIELVELHHGAKRDAPSGTALMLAEAAARGRSRLLEAVRLPPRDGLGGPRPAGGIGMAALRGGTAAGDHDVLFLGPGERLRLAHVAEDRRIFATGALTAARWLAGRPAGRYRMADVLGLAEPRA